MFKFVVFAALVALAAAKPLVVEYAAAPVAYAAYSAPAPLAYSAYTAAAYSAPVAYSAYSYASPYSYYLR